jgi:cyclophilin family peptidyl-prolyl cis-trans isomerase
MQTAHFSQLFHLRTFALFTMGCALLSVTNLYGKAPAAPTGGELRHSYFGNPANGTSSVPTSTWRTWSIEWEDNAIDEEGYIISVRLGNVGPFYTARNLSADSTQVTFSIEAVDPGNIIQFRVEAWKRNGTAIESSALIIPTVAPPAPTGAAFSAPTGIACSQQDLDPGAGTSLSDGFFKLTWNDNSYTELDQQVQMREIVTGMTDASWRDLGTVSFNIEEITLFNKIRYPGTNSNIQFIPGKPYQFRVRAIRGSEVTNFSETSSDTNTANTPHAFIIPDLNAPTDLNASSAGENQLLLSWADNSQNETGYNIEFRFITESTPPAFQNFGDVGENVRSVLVPASQNATAEFRIRALYQYTPSGTTTATRLYSAFAANTAQASTSTFAPPSDLTATTSAGMDGTIDLTWKDNSSTEGGFDILLRPAGTTINYKFARAVPANVTRVSVNSIAGTVGADGLPTATNFAPLTAGTAYEFIVRAVGNSESIVSLSSASATATPKAGFTMPRLFQPAQKGQTFTYQVSTSTTIERTGWSVGGLPNGLSFNNETGLISGTPLADGTFLCPLLANFTGGGSATATLTLRVLDTLAPPTAATPISNLTVGLGTPATIGLADKFTDPDAETAVRLITTKGNIDMMLYPSLAPQGVANFLAYVNAGDYNGMAFHRLIAGFILQGGSIRAIAAPRSFESISKRTSPTNEPGISNLRGTIASAKIGSRNSSFSNGAGTVDRDDSFGYLGSPDSATSDFFFNLGNNAANLDNQNSGFTAFGRVTTSGMAVVDAISAVPIGSYTSDKSLIVDGTLVPFTSIPMNAATAPANMDVNQTVRVLSASVISPFAYSVNDVSANIATVVIQDGQIKITGLAAGTRNVILSARDLDGNTTAQNFTITVTPGHLHPSITKQPVSIVVNAGKPAAFSVNATGTALTYQWRRGGTNLTGKTDPTLTLDNAQAGDAGVYDVLVSNATTTLTSAPATLAIRTPADITSTLPNELLIEAGQPLDLAVTVVGAPEPTFTWRRGSTVIKGQITKRLLINATTLTDAGIYKGTATNGSTDTTNACNVLIVDKARRIIVAAPGKPVKLTAPVAGPFLTYRWRKGGVNIPLDQPGFSGMTSATLSINAAAFGTDSGDYTCVLTPPGSLPVTISGILHLAVSNAPQLTVMTGNNAPPSGVVGSIYAYNVPYPKDENGNPFDQNTPTSFILKNLPPGLAYNAATGLIFGVPTSSGSFTFTAQAKNATGSGNIVSGTIFIQSMRAATTGSYVALITSSSELNGGHGGRLNLTITDNAAFSASLQLGKDTYPLKGSLFLGQNNGNEIYLASINFKSKLGKTLNLGFNVFAVSGTLIGAISDGTLSADLSGHRQFWEASRNPCLPVRFNGFGGLFNLALSLRAADLGKAGIPQGDGYMTLSNSAAGISTFAGRLPEGTSITGSSIISSSGQVMLFQMLYANNGSLLTNLGVRSGRRDTNDAFYFNSFNGEARLIKNPAAPTKELLYKTGFPATFMDVRGWEYQEPNSLITPIVMNLTNVANNARLDFAEGGLAAAAQNPDTDLTLDNGNKATFPAANPTKVTLNVNPATGAYSGTFVLVDGSVKRPVAFQGLIIPTIGEIAGLQAVLNSNGETVLPAQQGVSPTGAYGAGYFLLDQLPTPPKATFSERRSGKAQLSAKPFTIDPQPQPVTVDPGENASFNFTVQGGLNDPNATLSYQWRHNGTNLTNGSGVSGATTSNLSLSLVDESDQGSYDCVIKKTLTVSNTTLDVNIVTTQAATLTVNDPLSDVIVVQTPTASLQPDGAQITFSVENKGTGPFTYQWQKNAVDILGATNSTYVIASMTSDHAGNYRVIVKSDITPGGVTSSAKSLAHAVPVTTVTATQSINSSSIAAGSLIKFTATANGSTPLIYQWLRNNIPITAAQSATYTINSTAVADSGTYKVQVTNAVTSTPATSNELAVLVTQNISNIQIAKSYTGVAALPNTSVSFTVSNQGTGPFNYQWRKNGVNLDGETFNTLTVVTGAEVNISNPDSYDVLITSALVPLGAASPPVELLIAIPVSNIIASRTPTNSSLATGTDGITFSVSATGSNLSYQWRKDNTDILDATSSTYVINDATPTQSGLYSVKVSNIVTPAGIMSANVPLNVMDPVQTATAELTAPISTTVSPGAILNFTGSADGGSSFTYQWRKDGVAIPEATDATLNTTADTTAGNYIYDVVVSNPVTSVGIVSNQITITVR